MYFQPELILNPSVKIILIINFANANDQNMRMLFCWELFNPYKKRQGMFLFSPRFNIHIFPSYFPFRFLAPLILPALLFSLPFSPLCVTAMYLPPYKPNAHYAPSLSPPSGNTERNVVCSEITTNFITTLM